MGTHLRFAASVTSVVLILASVSAQSQSAVVVATAPVRIAPDTARTPLTTLKPGMTVHIEEREGDWYKVSFRDPQWGQRVGYVRAEHISLKAPSSNVTSPPAPVGTSPAATTPAPELPPASPPPPPPTASAPKPSLATPEPAQAPAPVRAPAAASNSGSLSRRAIEESIAIGLKQRGRKQGLFLSDTSQQWAAALTAGGTGATASNGFSVQAYTPLAWIRQLASDAAKEYRQFTISDVEDEAMESIFRLIVFPDTPNTVTAAGMRGTSSVQHVVLRDDSRRVVVQPTFKEPFSEEAANAMGGKATFLGVQAKFPLDALREIRGARGDREFFITVIGSSGEEKDFKVKKKHFDELP